MGLPKLTVIHPKTSLATPVQRNVALAPLPSQLAKVIKPKVEQKELPQPAKTEFKTQLPAQKPIDKINSHESRIPSQTLSTQKAETECKPPVHIAKDTKLSQIMEVSTTSTQRNPIQLPIEKPSIQFKQIKVSVPLEDYVPLPPGISVRSAGSSKVYTPLELWTNESYTNVQRIEKYCGLKFLTPPIFDLYALKNNTQTEYLCRCTVNGSAYSTYPDFFDTKKGAVDACAAVVVSAIKLEEESSQYPTVLGSSSQEIASKINDILNESATGVFLSEIPRLFR